jgi:hypothetical protein
MRRAAVQTGALPPLCVFASSPFVHAPVCLITSHDNSLRSAAIQISNHCRNERPREAQVASESRDSCEPVSFMHWHTQHCDGVTADNPMPEDPRTHVPHMHPQQRLRILYILYISPRAGRRLRHHDDRLRFAYGPL